jgi:hypothetical protein
MLCNSTSLYEANLQSMAREMLSKLILPLNKDSGAVEQIQPAKETAVEDGALKMRVRMLLSDESMLIEALEETIFLDQQTSGSECELHVSMIYFIYCIYTQSYKKPKLMHLLASIYS